MARFIAQFVLALLILAAISTVHASGLEDGLSAICNGNYFRIQDCGVSSARNGVTAQRIKLSEIADS
jgi:hypothetical protein